MFRRGEPAYLASFGLPWALLSAPSHPSGPHRGPLGALTASLDGPSPSSGPFPSRGHRALDDDDDADGILDGLEA